MSAKVSCPVPTDPIQPARDVDRERVGVAADLHAAHIGEDLAPRIRMTHEVVRGVPWRLPQHTYADT
ncbi:hypothetical protein [Micromonospora sp. KC721]|uniref:hypothetical protein n=1 Tax=Micromonospora sp. KC721 TaxID=2530380 RepID=UPI00140538BA|nr:hypothetical protein [Micromonospora sp. KC721]